MGLRDYFAKRNFSKTPEPKGSVKRTHPPTTPPLTPHLTKNPPEQHSAHSAPVRSTPHQSGSPHPAHPLTPHPDPSAAAGSAPHQSNSLHPTTRHAGLDPASNTKTPLRFVIQKHHASQLHYDFRLELDGVLKSWAVPKGPSTDPTDRHLAMQVEDHPFEYRNFEGVIPEGNYGAGNVIIWDEGTYEPRVETDDPQATLRAELKKGHITFLLHGTKLNGEFALIKMHGKDEKAWLLIKKGDEFATHEDVTQQSTSVISAREVDDLGAHNKLPDLKKYPKKSKPWAVMPMLCTLVDKPFTKQGWLFEIKWDGYRAITERKGRTVELYSRNGKDYRSHYPPIYEAIQALDHDVVLDGEIVIVDKQGKPHFEWLQGYRDPSRRNPAGTIIYYVFDILWLDGRDLRSMPLRERKQLLKAILPVTGAIRYSDHVETDGEKLFTRMQQAGLEGIVAKRADSAYREDVRGNDWLKVKTHQRQEVVIGGYTEPKGGRKYIGSLLVGLYKNGEFVYAGHSGGGIGHQELADLHKRLKKLERKTSAFKIEPKPNAPVHWVKPELVCEMSFTEWTVDGSMRHPKYEGLRMDKPATDVHHEPIRPAAKPTSTPQPAATSKATSAESAIAPKSQPSTSQPKTSTPRHSTSTSPHSTSTLRHSGLDPESKTHNPAAPEANGPSFTHLDKIFFPKHQYTKGDLLDYYRSVADYILPYLDGRPLSLLRQPNGVTDKGFFQKDIQHLPAWVPSKDIYSEGHGGDMHWMVGGKLDTLLYAVQLGSIEINPWNSTIQHQDKPDWIVIDLDPEGSITFKDVVQVAQTVHQVCDEWGVPSYPKTSGKTGIHIYIPLAAQYTYEQARTFAHLLAIEIHNREPKITSIERTPAKRPNKIYVDYLQNRESQTLAAPYSVRPTPDATVSTPLRWDEVTPKLKPTDFTIRNIGARLEKVGDLWKPVLGTGIDIPKILDGLYAGKSMKD